MAMLALDSKSLFPTVCINCEKNVSYKKSSLLFCECEIVFCQDCVFQCLLRSSKGLDADIICPKCRKITPNEYLIRPKSKEEVEGYINALIDSAGVCCHLRTRLSRSSSGTSYIPYIEHYRQIGFKRYCENAENLGVSQIRILIARLESFRLNCSPTVRKFTPKAFSGLVDDILEYSSGSDLETDESIGCPPICPLCDVFYDPSGDLPIYPLNQLIVVENRFLEDIWSNNISNIPLTCCVCDSLSPSFSVLFMCTCNQMFCRTCELNILESNIEIRDICTTISYSVRCPCAASTYSVNNIQNNAFFAELHRLLYSAGSFFKIDISKNSGLSRLIRIFIECGFLDISKDEPLATMKNSLKDIKLISLARIKVARCEALRLEVAQDPSYHRYMSVSETKDLIAKLGIDRNEMYLPLGPLECLTITKNFVIEKVLSMRSQQDELDKDISDSKEDTILLSSSSFSSSLTTSTSLASGSRSSGDLTNFSRLSEQRSQTGDRDMFGEDNYETDDANGDENDTYDDTREFVVGKYDIEDDDEDEEEISTSSSMKQSGNRRTSSNDIRDGVQSYLCPFGCIHSHSLEKLRVHLVKKHRDQSLPLSFLDYYGWSQCEFCGHIQPLSTKPCRSCKIRKSKEKKKQINRMNDAVNQNDNFNSSINGCLDEAEWSDHFDSINSRNIIISQPENQEEDLGGEKESVESKNESFYYDLEGNKFTLLDIWGFSFFQGESGNIASFLQLIEGGIVRGRMRRTSMINSPKLRDFFKNSCDFKSKSEVDVLKDLLDKEEIEQEKDELEIEFDGWKVFLDPKKYGGIDNQGVNLNINNGLNHGDILLFSSRSFSHPTSSSGTIYRICFPHRDYIMWGIEIKRFIREYLNLIGFSKLLGNSSFQSNDFSALGFNRNYVLQHQALLKILLERSCIDTGSQVVKMIACRVNEILGAISDYVSISSEYVRNVCIWHENSSEENLKDIIKEEVYDKSFSSQSTPFAESIPMVNDKNLIESKTLETSSDCNQSDWNKLHTSVGSFGPSTSKKYLVTLENLEIVFFSSISSSQAKLSEFSRVRYTILFSNKLQPFFKGLASFSLELSSWHTSLDVIPSILSSRFLINFGNIQYLRDDDSILLPSQSFSEYNIKPDSSILLRNVRDCCDEDDDDEDINSESFVGNLIPVVKEYNINNNNDVRDSGKSNVIIDSKKPLGNLALVSSHHWNKDDVVLQKPSNELKVESKDVIVANNSSGGKDGTSIVGSSYDSLVGVTSLSERWGRFSFWITVPLQLIPEKEWKRRKTGNFRIKIKFRVHSKPHKTSKGKINQDDVFFDTDIYVASLNVGFRTLLSHFKMQTGFHLNVEEFYCHFGNRIQSTRNLAYYNYENGSAIDLYPDVELPSESYSGVMKDSIKSAINSSSGSTTTSITSVASSTTTSTEITRDLPPKTSFVSQSNLIETSVAPNSAYQETIFPEKSQLEYFKGMKNNENSNLQSITIKNEEEEEEKKRMKERERNEIRNADMPDPTLSSNICGTFRSSELSSLVYSESKYDDLDLQGSIDPTIESQVYVEKINDHWIESENSRKRKWNEHDGDHHHVLLSKEPISTSVLSSTFSSCLSTSSVLTPSILPSSCTFDNSNSAFPLPPAPPLPPTPPLPPPLMSSSSSSPSSPCPSSSPSSSQSHSQSLHLLSRPPLPPLQPLSIPTVSSVVSSLSLPSSSSSSLSSSLSSSPPSPLSSSRSESKPFNDKIDSTSILFFSDFEYFKMRNNNVNTNPSSSISSASSKCEFSGKVTGVSSEAFYLDDDFSEDEDDDRIKNSRQHPREKNRNMNLNMNRSHPSSRSTQSSSSFRDNIQNMNEICAEDIIGFYHLSRKIRCCTTPRCDKVHFNPKQSGLRWKYWSKNKIIDNLGEFSLKTEVIQAVLNDRYLK